MTLGLGVEARERSTSAARRADSIAPLPLISGGSSQGLGKRGCHDHDWERNQYTLSFC